jgi:Pyruvate/2-oxoacid:ferredoxin oxidoreductase delta subunit
LDDEVRLIEIDGGLVGLVGLKEVFEELSRDGPDEAESLRRVLLERVRVKNYVPEERAEAYAEAIYRAFERHRDGENEGDRERAGMTWRGIARETIQWYPTVDETACDGCMKCLDFCSFGVFAYCRESETVCVENRYACVVGCSLCATLCKPRAITFPPLSYLDDLIRSRG